MKTKFVEFGGERYEVPADAKPRSIAVAQRMQKALRAAEKPAEAPSRSSGGGGSRKASSAPSAAPSASPRPARKPTRMDADRESAKARRIARDAMDAIGASNKEGMNANTRKVETKDERPLTSGRSSTGRVNYPVYDRLYRGEPDSSDFQVRVRAGLYNSGKRTQRNARAERERRRRGLK